MYCHVDNISSSSDNVFTEMLKYFHMTMLFIVFLNFEDAVLIDKLVCIPCLTGKFKKVII